MPPNIYVYKCVVDDGTAPCTDGSLLSMTVCKPKVRTSAKVGDIGKVEYRRRRSR